MISSVGHIIRIIIIIVVTAFGLKAQSFNPRYNFKQLNVQNGLIQNIVYHFLQDSQGYMWIGTHNGLTLYDGIKTTNFLHNEQDSTSISGNFINSIIEDSAQRIWIGNENGIAQYNPEGNSFSHFPVERENGTTDTTYCVILGFVSSNELWFLDTKTRSVRALNVKTKGSSHISGLDAYHAMLYKASDQTVHIWSCYDLGTIHQTYKHSKLTGQQTYFTGKNGSLNEPALVVSHVLQQNDSTVWLSTTGGLVKLNPSNNQHRIFNQWGKQNVKELRYTALSAKGKLWVGTGPEGIYIFDTYTNQFTDNLRNNKLDPFSICSDNIVSLYFDKTGNIWCGSYGNGSSYAKTENNFYANHLPKKEMHASNGNNNISWLGVDPRQNVWCMLADAPGILMLDKEFKVRMHRIPLLENGMHFSGGINKLLFENDDEIWCATTIGLYKYNISSNRMHQIKYDLISTEVQGSIWLRDIIRLRDGSIIFSTFAGLYWLTNDSGKRVVKPINFLRPGAYIGFGKLFQDNADLLYVKSLGDSLYILNPGSNKKEYILFKSLRFKPQINQTFSEISDSVIYLATHDGLYHMNSQNFQIEKEDFNDRLPFSNISSVFKKDHKFWVFGEKGLYFFNEKNNQGRTYTVEDGLPSNEFALSAFVYSANNRCIAGSSNGLVSFFPQQQQDSIYPPRPRLTNIYINDILFNLAGNPNETKKISLSYRENTFSFDFSPIAFQHAAESSFEFKLEGYDETWVKTDVSGSARYSKIPPGNYVFNLRVLDAMGRISPFTKTLEIQVARAFWQTTLFKIAAGLLIVLIGWMVLKWYFRYRIMKQKLEFEKQQAIERERTRIATDMHDDLGAGLSRIKFLSQVLRNKEENDESIKTGLEKITGYSDEMAEKMGEIVWALNEKNDTLADLVAYSRSYAIEYLANHDIICKANTPLGLPGSFIAGEIRRNIFLSVKECLHNIVKHAGASCVDFSVELSNKIQITIHDNGRGIDWNNQRAFSNGIQNIQQRMKEIKGEVKFYNELGTKVVLIIPISL